MLLEKKGVFLEDMVRRALGTLASARLLDTEEAINLLSRIRVGRALELIDGPSMEDIHRLLLHVQPAHLCSDHGSRAR